MAGYVIHRIIGEDITQQLSLHNTWRTYIEEHKVAFIWGTQGPDTLFHDTKFLSLLRKRGPINNYGGYMHRQSTDLLFNRISCFLINKKDSTEFPALVAFACGFICHYCVDRHIHACVYNRMRVYNGVVETFRPRDVHMKLETDMDTAYYRLRTGKDVRSFELEPEMRTNKQDIHAIELFFDYLIENVYNARIPPGSVEKAVDFFYQKEKFLFDKYGIKSRLFCRTKEIIYGEKKSYTLYCRPANVSYDVLNMSHAPWVHPLNPNEICFLSIPELLERSIDEAVAMISEMKDCVDREKFFERQQMDSFDCGNDDSPKPY